jgi:ATP-dependent helicase/DNAse subunit B
LFEFYSEIRDKNISFRDNETDQKTINEAKRILFTIAKKKLDDAVFSSPLAFLQREKILGYDGKKEDSILNLFIETEKEMNTGKPSFFEVSFGTMDRKESDELISMSEPLKMGSVKLRGKIDRVDLTDDGAITVIDYKLSGKTITAKDLNRGIQLQLQVYLHAVYSMLAAENPDKYKPSGMGIYSLKFSEKDFGFKFAVPYHRRKRMTEEEKISAMTELIDNTSKQIIEYVQAIKDGKFNLSPWEDREKLVCNYCNLSYVCRVENL